MTRRRPSRAQHPSSLPDHRWTTGLDARVLGQPARLQAYAAHTRILWRGKVPVAGVSLEPSRWGGQPWWYAVILTRAHGAPSARFANKHTTRREAMRWIEQKIGAPLAERRKNARALRAERRKLRRVYALYRSTLSASQQSLIAGSLMAIALPTMLFCGAALVGEA